MGRAGAAGALAAAAAVAAVAVVGIVIVGAVGAAAADPLVSVDLAVRDDDDEFPSGALAVGGLASGAVLRVRVEGFASHATAAVRQCVTTTTVVCGTPFPVQFDEDGRALFQYRVLDDFHAAVGPSGGCRAGAARCTLVVEESDGDSDEDPDDRTVADIDTVFVDAVPEPGVVRVSPVRDLVDGERVAVRVSGYPPGAEVEARLCAAPAVDGRARCGAPGPHVPIVVGPDGAGSATLVVHPGPVGTSGVECGRGRTCGIVVVGERTYARAAAVPISFAAPPGADYDPTRVVTGLGVAALLVGSAGWVIRRTDWSPVGELAAPEIDEAEYADLDAIVAALPPEE
jgi:hypothetical protein